MQIHSGPYTPTGKHTAFGVFGEGPRSLSSRSPGARPWGNVPGDYPGLAACDPGLWGGTICSDSVLHRDFDGKSGHCGVCLGLCRLAWWEKKSQRTQGEHVTASSSPCTCGGIILWSGDWHPLAGSKGRNGEQSWSSFKKLRNASNNNNDWNYLSY